MKKKSLFFMLFSLMVIIWSVTNAQASTSCCQNCSSGDNYCSTGNPAVKAQNTVNTYQLFVTDPPNQTLCIAVEYIYWTENNCTGTQIQMYSSQVGPYCGPRGVGSTGNGSGITIKGDYAIVGSDTCVSHMVSNHRDSDTTYCTKTNNFRGTITFYENGTGVAHLTFVSLTHPEGETDTINVVVPVSYSIDPVSRLMTVTFTLTGHVTSEVFINKWPKTSAFTLTGIVPGDFGTILLFGTVDSTPAQDVCGMMGILTLPHTLQNQNQCR